MTPLREAIVLPVMFLTVVLIAAIRPGADVSVSPPSLGSLVAGAAIFALLIRSGALAPERLMNAGRSSLANLNGASVLVVTFAASAQLVMALVPESGVPALVTWIVLASLLAQAFAISPDRRRLLRGLLVTFGAAFVLKFIILAALSSPTESRATRALQILFDGLTLGIVTQRPAHPIEGYLTFAAVVLYLVAVALLPPAPWEMIRLSPTSPPTAIAPGDSLAE